MTQDPMTGMAQQIPTPPQASIQPNPMDDHPAHISAIQAWHESPNGREEREKNPAGWQNVFLHWQAHKTAMQPPAPPPGAMPLPGAPGPHGPGGPPGPPQPPHIGLPPGGPS
jgi:hypothetical protein